MHLTKIKKSLLIVLILTITTVFSQEKKAYKVNTVAFYNLKNLFDTENDPLTNDDDRTQMEKIIGQKKSIKIN